MKHFRNGSAAVAAFVPFSVLVFVRSRGRRSARLSRFYRSVAFRFHVYRFGLLFERLNGKGDLLLFGAERKNFCIYFLPDAEHGRRIFQPFVGNLRNVHKPVDSLFQFDERAERNDTYDFSVHHVALRVFFRRKIPRLRL